MRRSGAGTTTCCGATADACACFYVNQGVGLSGGVGGWASCNVEGVWGLAHVRVSFCLPAVVGPPLTQASPGGLMLSPRVAFWLGRYDAGADIQELDQEEGHGGGFHGGFPPDIFNVRAKGKVAVGVECPLDIIAPRAKELSGRIADTQPAFACPPFVSNKTWR